MNNDLISRKALLEIVRSKMEEYALSRDEMSAIEWAENEVLEAPAVGAAPTWISVEERLPGRGEVIVCCPDPDRPVQSAWYDGDRWLNHYGRSIGLPVTHWMPLPEPPKEERHE